MQAHITIICLHTMKDEIGVCPEDLTEMVITTDITTCSIMLSTTGEDGQQTVVRMKETSSTTTIKWDHPRKKNILSLLTWKEPEREHRAIMSVEIYAKTLTTPKLPTRTSSGDTLLAVDKNSIGQYSKTNHSSRPWPILRALKLLSKMYCRM